MAFNFLDGSQLSSSFGNGQAAGGLRQTPFMLGGGESTANTGGGLFSGLSSGDVLLGQQVAGALGDISSRNIKGDLAAVEAATAPFAKGSILDAFEQGPGGGDAIAAIGEGMALKQAAEERDRVQVLLNKFGEASAKNVDLQNQNLQQTLDDKILAARKA